MAELVFDIETVGEEYDNLSTSIQETITKRAKTEEELQDLKQKTGLFPLSGKVVAIAVMDLATNLGKVYYQSSEKNKKNYKKLGFDYEVRDEKQILKGFWQGVEHYSKVITFNGRSFDAPFLVLRSIYHGIPINKNLIPYRYSNQYHFDIMDQLSFYGASRKYSLSALCDFLNIKNPKDEGVSGLEVNNLFAKKEYEKIAEYCARDVKATAELYLKVKGYIF